jgi:DNA-binding NtrC family response regulator
MEAWILIVDDDAGTREALADILGRAGYRVEASDGGPGLGEVLTAHAYQAAVVDYHLPTATGLMVARDLKERQPNCRVLIISAALPAEACPVGGGCLADGFLAKPFSKDAILGELARLLASGRT